MILRRRRHKIEEAWRKEVKKRNERGEEERPLKKVSLKRGETRKERKEG